MQGYKYILFDLDGTLTHSHPGIYACFRYALQKMGRKEAQQENLRCCIGPSLMYSFQTYFGMNEAEATKATAFYRERYSVEGWKENSPIEGAIETLNALKQAGYVLALATSKPLIYANRITERFGFSKFLTVQMGPDMDGHLPTKALVIAEAMKALGAKAEECLMIGDRKHDAEGAKENGVDCALLRVGYAESEEEFKEAKPRYVLKDFQALRELLLK